MEKEQPLMTSAEVEKAADVVAKENDADVFLYNGSITSANVLRVMEDIQKNQSRKRLLLLLVTYGGDPHAAYKISRYIQDHYEHFVLLVGGFCKSAGTFFAIAANQVVFAPFGELGPLDVQMVKPDHFQFDSGLVIGESLDTLERRAAELFKRMFQEVMAEQQGLVSVNSALHAAAEVTKAVYQPIMGRVDPEEVGVRKRALQIALDYGSRLAVKSQNVGPKTVKLLAEKYSSHSFVIDRQEASSLFKNVRPATKAEMELVYSLKAAARIEQSSNIAPTFSVLSKPHVAQPTSKKEGLSNGKTKREGSPKAHGRHSSRANGAPVAASKLAPRGRGGGIRSRNASNGRATTSDGA